MKDIEGWIKVIDEGEDPLHADITPAVLALGEIGLPAVPRVIDLLDAPNEMTRLRAQRALEAIVNQQFGFRYGQGFPNREAEETVRALWRTNGDYAYDGSAETRGAAKKKWREWAARKNGVR
jgi:hypothetical protein